MNFIEKLPDGSRCEAGYTKLALMAIFAILITAAIDRQLAAQASDGTAVVSLGDLDLETEKGIHLARERLREAARRLCAKEVNRRGPR